MREFHVRVEFSYLTQLYLTCKLVIQLYILWQLKIVIDVKITEIIIYLVKGRTD